MEINIFINKKLIYEEFICNKDKTSSHMVYYVYYSISIIEIFHFILDSCNINLLRLYDLNRCLDRKYFRFYN
jgi:hypothetical protein